MITRTAVRSCAHRWLYPITSHNDKFVQTGEPKRSGTPDLVMMRLYLLLLGSQGQDCPHLDEFRHVLEVLCVSTVLLPQYPCA